MKAILKAVADSNLSPSTRCIAVNALGDLNYAEAAGTNQIEAAVAIGQFLSDSCGDELRLAKQSGKGVSRRRMKQRFSAAMVALTGEDESKPKGIASLDGGAAAKAYLGELQQIISAAMKVVDDKQDTSLQDAVGQWRTKLDAWIAKKPK